MSLGAGWLDVFVVNFILFMVTRPCRAAEDTDASIKREGGRGCEKKKGVEINRNVK